MLNIILVLVLKFLINFLLYSSVWSLILIEGGFSITHLSIYLTLTYLVQTFCEIPSGLISDFLGAKKTLLAGQLLLLFALVIFYVHFDFFTLIILAIATGMSNALYTDTDTTLVYRELRAAGQTHLYPRFLAFFNTIGFVGLSLASIFGAWLAAHFTLRSTIIATIPFILLYMFIVQFLHDPGSSNADCESPAYTPDLVATTWRAIISQPITRATIIYSSLLYGLNMIIWSYYQNYAEDINIPLIYFGVLGVAFSISEAIPQYLSRFFVSIPHLEKFYGWLTFLAASNCFLASLFPDQLGLVFLLISVLLTGFTFPITDTVLRRHCQLTSWTTIASFKTFACIFTFAIFSLFVGLTAETQSLSYSLLYLSIFIIAVTFIYPTFGFIYKLIKGHS